MTNCIFKKSREAGKKLTFKRFMLLYAAIFLGVALLGLAFFWGYMDAYEDSRTKSTIETYIENLTPQYVYDRSGDVLDQIDPKLQSAEERDKALLDFLNGNITYAKKSSESTDTRMVYMLRRGMDTIGKVELEPTGKKRFGFTQWVISQDSFDLSCLLGDAATVTVDQSMQVYYGDMLLDESYVTETAKYAAVEEHYDDLNLPYKKTYTVGPIFGEVELRVVNAEGNTVEIDDETDVDAFLNNCSDALHQELDTFIHDFIDRYTRYLTSRLDNRQENYNALVPLLLDGSDLKYRVSRAYDGFQYGQSKSDTITSFVTHYLIDAGDGKYLCDVTYEVDSLGRDGKLHHSVNNAQVILVRSGNSFLAERLISY